MLGGAGAAGGSWASDLGTPWRRHFFLFFCVRGCSLTDDFGGGGVVAAWAVVGVIGEERRGGGKDGRLGRASVGVFRVGPRGQQPISGRAAAPPPLHMATVLIH